MFLNIILYTLYYSVETIFVKYSQKEIDLCVLNRDRLGRDPRHLHSMVTSKFMTTATKDRYPVLRSVNWRISCQKCKHFLPSILFHIEYGNDTFNIIPLFN